MLDVQYQNLINNLLISIIISTLRMLYIISKKKYCWQFKVNITIKNNFPLSKFNCHISTICVHLYMYNLKMRSFDFYLIKTTINILILFSSMCILIYAKLFTSANPHSMQICQELFFFISYVIIWKKIKLFSWPDFSLRLLFLSDEFYSVSSHVELVRCTFV